MAINPDPESKHISHLVSVSTLSFRFFYVIYCLLVLTVVDLWTV